MMLEFGVGGEVEVKWEQESKLVLEWMWGVEVVLFLE
jgi:hypothetical protein